MAVKRRSFQGVWNIVRFNWHFYVIAFALLLPLLVAAAYLDQSWQLFIYGCCSLASLSIILSLLVSFYVYDRSGLYNLHWIEEPANEVLILNISAGFDETSALLQDRFRSAKLLALDFYDPSKHTEISIRRARTAYPPFPKTVPAKTTGLPLGDHVADRIFVILSAHEIRDANERTAFFRELARVIKPTGQIYITEHLRDVPNFIAYTIGFLHFYSKNSWLRTFERAELKLLREIKLTPFISTFVLGRHGHTL